MVELHHVQPGTAGQQAGGNSALAWTNLDQVITFAWRDGTDNAIYHASIMQEVLTKALTRLVLGELIHSALRAAIICAAVSIATIRLPAFAVPLPARSSAVP